MGDTSIEWTDRSVNPFRARRKGSKATVGGYASGVGHYCEKVSPGCANCYSSATQPRFGLPVFQEQRRGGIETFLDASKFEDVLRRKTPTKFFWCDMTDMFGAWVTNEQIAACFGVMAATPQHTHQVLTKRADRMRDWFAWLDMTIHGRRHAHFCISEAYKATPQHIGNPFVSWPLPNVWLGVSVEDQRRADERIPLLLDTPAAVRFLSCEPLLGPVAIAPGVLGCKGHLAETFGNPLIHWLIVGSESGHGARPMDIAWARSLVDQGTTAEVAIFTKQIATPGHPKGGDPEFWPSGIWPREFPL